jgi:hypothetical protein
MRIMRLIVRALNLVAELVLQLDIGPFNSQGVYHKI